MPEVSPDIEGPTAKSAAERRLEFIQHRRRLAEALAPHSDGMADELLELFDYEELHSAAVHLLQEGEV